MLTMIDTLRYASGKREGGKNKQEWEMRWSALRCPGIDG